MLDFLHADAWETAEKLIGCELVYNDHNGKRGGIIVETEAYTASDPASHSYKGRTVRNAAMFESAGTIYMYQIYGKHLCLNIVSGNSDGQAVLIRALEPTKGIDFMKRQRRSDILTQLCSGPAKLVEALALPKQLNGQHLQKSRLLLLKTSRKFEISRSGRIGITKATETDWRFYVKDSPFISRPG